MIKLKDLITEIKIKVLSGHLTARDKQIVKHLLDKGLDSGRVNKKDWFIKDLGKGKYEVIEKAKERGIGLGAGLVLRTHKSQILVKENLLTESKMYIAPLTEYWIDSSGGKVEHIVVLTVDNKNVTYWVEKTGKVVTIDKSKAEKLIYQGSKEWYDNNKLFWPKVAKSLEKNFDGKKGLSSHNGAKKNNKGIMNIVKRLENE